MNLRRLLTALAVLALCAGLASAQVVTPTPINCSVTAAVPTLRSQGVTERPGDVLITCTGGPAPNVGSTLLEVDRATIQVSFAGVPITNSTHGDGVSIGGNAQNSTDALLLIDEPNDPAGPLRVTDKTRASPYVPLFSRPRMSSWVQPPQPIARLTGRTSTDIGCWISPARAAAMRLTLTRAAPRTLTAATPC